MTLEKTEQFQLKHSPRVAILLCTYNGERFIAEQLESILAQSYTNWFTVVSDDGSSDATLNILSNYKSIMGDKLEIRSGPKEGFARNFISLLCDSEIQADYFAFADQDDIWHQDKISRSVTALEKKSSKNIPAIYCGRTRLVNEEGRYIGMSPLFSRKPSFQNALVQSIAGANTMMINKNARSLTLSIPLDNVIIAHDWLVYIIVTAVGGQVIYDPDPSLDYRQHDKNLIGGNAGFWARSKRIRLLIQGRFQKWTAANLGIIQHIRSKLTPNNILTLQYFETSHCHKGTKALAALVRSGVYRQTFAGQCSLLLAATLGKL